MIRDIFLLQNPWRKQKDHKFPEYSRKIENILKENLSNKKILGLVGSRQVGKSSLLYRLINHLINSGISPEEIFYFNLDDLKLHELLNIVDFIQFIGTGKNRKYIFFDEIQRLENPGLFLKELHDLNLPFKIIYSGSSQLEIKAKLKENLVGRARVIIINRLCLSEIMDFASPVTEKEALSHAMIYGTYPGVCLAESAMNRKLELKDIFQSYIEKDIIDFLKVKNTQAFNKLLILVAKQTGGLLNIDGLSKSLKLSRNTIEEYLNILEGTFIVKRVYPYYRNYKKELTKQPKIYFLDNGLKNFILSNFTALDKRTDTGELFENFILTELIKSDYYSMHKINFWRTTNQTEINFILQNESGLNALEVKWNKHSTPKSFRTFSKLYPEARCRLINMDNYSQILWYLNGV